MSDTNKTGIWIAVALIAVALIIAGAMIIVKDKEIKAETKTSDMKTLESNGDSTIEVMANKVSIMIGYDSRNSTADAAQEDNKIVSAKIISALESAGLNKSDVETMYYNVGPEYDWSDGKQTLKGYLATHTLKISTTQVDKIGKFIDAAVRAGANRIDSIDYELTTDKENELKAQVLKTAAENARAKADAIASGSGTKIVKLVSVQDTSYNYAPWNYRLDYAVSAESKAGGAMPVVNVPTQVETGKVTITASVRTVYQLE